MKLDLNCERGPRCFGDCKTNSIPGRYCGRYYDSLVGIVRGSLGGEGFSCAHTCVLGQDKTASAAAADSDGLAVSK